MQSDIMDTELIQMNVFDYHHDHNPTDMDLRAVLDYGLFDEGKLNMLQGRSRELIDKKDGEKMYSHSRNRTSSSSARESRRSYERTKADGRSSPFWSKDAPRGNYSGRTERSFTSSSKHSPADGYSQRRSSHREASYRSRNDSPPDYKNNDGFHSYDEDQNRMSNFEGRRNRPSAKKRLPSEIHGKFDEKYRGIELFDYCHKNFDMDMGTEISDGEKFSMRLIDSDSDEQNYLESTDRNIPKPSIQTNPDDVLYMRLIDKEDEQEKTDLVEHASSESTKKRKRDNEEMSPEEKPDSSKSNDEKRRSPSHLGKKNLVENVSSLKESRSGIKSYSSSSPSRENRNKASPDRSYTRYSRSPGLDGRRGHLKTSDTVGRQHYFDDQISAHSDMARHTESNYKRLNHLDSPPQARDVRQDLSMPAYRHNDFFDPMIGPLPTYRDQNSPSFEQCEDVGMGKAYTGDEEFKKMNQQVLMKRLFFKQMLKMGLLNPDMETGPGFQRNDFEMQFSNKPIMKQFVGNELQIDNVDNQRIVRVDDLQRDISGFGSSINMEGATFDDIPNFRRPMQPYDRSEPFDLPRSQIGMAPSSLAGITEDDIDHFLQSKQNLLMQMQTSGDRNMGMEDMEMRNLEIKKNMFDYLMKMSSDQLQRVSSDDRNMMRQFDSDRGMEDNRMLNERMLDLYGSSANIVDQWMPRPVDDRTDCKDVGMTSSDMVMPNQQFDFLDVKRGLTGELSYNADDWMRQQECTNSSFQPMKRSSSEEAIFFKRQPMMDNRTRPSERNTDGNINRNRGFSPSRGRWQRPRRQRQTFSTRTDASQDRIQDRRPISKQQDSHDRQLLQSDGNRRDNKRDNRTSSRAELQHHQKMESSHRPSMGPSEKLGYLKRAPANPKRTNLVKEKQSPLESLHQYSLQHMHCKPNYVCREKESFTVCATVYIAGKEYATEFAANKNEAKKRAAFVTLCMLCPESYKMKDLRECLQNIVASVHDDTFFDDITLNDPRLPALCVEANKLHPYEILKRHMNKVGLSEKNIQADFQLQPNLNIGAYTMTIGTEKKIHWKVTVTAKSKSEGRIKSVQAVVQMIHPDIDSYGKLLELYSEADTKPCTKSSVSTSGNYGDDSNIIFAIQDTVRELDTHKGGVSSKLILGALQKSLCYRQLKLNVLKKRLDSLVKEKFLFVHKNGQYSITW